MTSTGAVLVWVLLAVPCTCLSWPPSELACRQICCHAGMGEEEVCGATSIYRDVNCYRGHCLVRSPRYNKHSVPVEKTKHMASLHLEPNKKVEETCPTTPVLWHTRTDSSTPLVVNLTFTVRSVSDIEMEENSITSAMRVEMKWYDSNLHICKCHREEDHEHSDEGGDSLVLGADVEDLIWVPDLSIWKYRTFVREEGLSMKKLNKIEVKEISKETVGTPGVIVKLDVDFMTSVTCRFNASWFPFDRNICKFQLGSYSSNKDTLVFQVINVDASELDKHFGEFSIKMFPLVGSDTTVVYDDVKLSLAGFKVEVRRNSLRVRRQYSVTMSFIVGVALGSILLSVTDDISLDRTGLLSGAIIVAVLVFQHAIEHSPTRDELNFTPALRFLIICIIFIGLSNVEYCIVSNIGSLVKIVLYLKAMKTMVSKRIVKELNTLDMKKPKTSEEKETAYEDIKEADEIEDENKEKAEDKVLEFGNPADEILNIVDVLENEDEKSEEEKLEKISDWVDLIVFVVLSVLFFLITILQWEQAERDAGVAHCHNKDIV